MKEFALDELLTILAEQIGMQRDDWGGGISLEWRLPKQRRGWWMAHWKKKWQQGWPTFLQVAMSNVGKVDFEPEEKE